MSRTTPSSLDAFWLAEAIRLREAQAGPVEDAEARRRAIAGGGDLQTRLLARAAWIGEREGLAGAQATARQGAGLALLLLALLALAGGTGMAVGALGEGQRPVNVFWALAGLLGLNLLSLLGWLLSLTLGGETGGALGRLWLWLSGALARDARIAQLGPALLVLLGRRRLTRWGLGLLVHGLWLLALLAALATLLALLATRRYGFVWETTLLGADAFVALTQGLGRLPALLGFPVPDAATIRASGELPLVAEAARHAWAGWLAGVLAVYGVAPRLLLAALCGWRWRRGVARLELDLGDPGYVLLGERLMPASERLGVNDAAPERATPASLGSVAAGEQGALLVAIELDERPWPPTLPAGVANAGVLDDGGQRRRLLEQLTRHPPARLAIACDPRRSPDRGTLALLGELARCAGATRVWLLPAPPGDTLDPARLADWRAALDDLGLPHGGASPLAWLERGDD